MLENIYEFQIIQIIFGWVITHYHHPISFSNRLPFLIKSYIITAAFLDFLIGEFSFFL